MTGSAKFKSVPIIDVTKENVAAMGPLVRGAIIGADFIAIDCELSGLGNRRRLNNQDIEERYEHTGNVAKTRSIISLGLSMFKLFKNNAGSPRESPAFPYHVQTFNILTLCAEDYIVEPGSLRFLVEHGFDFTKQYSEGLSYMRGNDRGQLNENNFVRQIFMEIIRYKKPIVLHNGFIDLVFLYQNLYATLPTSVNSFAADLAEMFPNGIYDTKYLSDYVCRKSASYLEYIFRSQQRKNIVLSDQERSSHVLLEFNSAEGQSSKHTQNRSCDYTNLFLSTKNWSTKICSDFSNHGHCTLGKRCPQSHDIDLIVLSKEVEVTKKDRKRKRSPPLPEKQKDVQNVLLSQQQDQDRQQFYDDTTRDSLFSTSEVETEKVSKPNYSTQSFDGKLSFPKAKSKMESSSGTSGIESDFRPDPLPDTASDESEKSSDSKKSKKESKKDPKQSNCGGHRAGYDAFMTGFSFATFIVHSALINPEEGAQSEPISKLLGVPVRPDFSDLRIANRIYLVCKDIPFIVRKSAYCKISLGHYEKNEKANQEKQNSPSKLNDLNVDKKEKEPPNVKIKAAV